MAWAPAGSARNAISPKANARRAAAAVVRGIMRRLQHWAPPKAANRVSVPRRTPMVHTRTGPRYEKRARAPRSLVAQCVDRVQLGRLPRRVEAEHDAHGRRDGERHQHTRSEEHTSQLQP